LFKLESSHSIYLILGLISFLDKYMVYGGAKGS